jgi:DNA polymerase III sliding clamp (beta) subunit (PCNA family)
VTGQVEFRAFQKSVERSLKALLDEKDRKGANAILTAGGGQLTIAFEAPEVGSGQASLPFANDGARPLSVTFNLYILENVLSGLRSVHKGLETCQVSLSGPASPMVLGAAAEHGQVLALVLPVAGV